MSPEEISQRRAKQLRAKAYYDMIALNEGYKTQVYEDDKGNRTIGIGFNLEDKANQKLLNQQGIDINELFKGRELNDKDPKFDKRSEGVKMALTDMSFNLGLTKLNKFKNMKEALQNDDYRTAAIEAQDSNWFNQVKDRGPRTVSLFNK